MLDRIFVTPALLAATFVALQHIDPNRQKAAAPEQVASADPFTAPPLRVALDLGGERVVTEIGRSVSFANGQEITVELLPTRVFAGAAPFTFEIPNEWRVSGGGNERRAWWSLMGDGALIHVQCFEGDADEAVQRYASGAQGNTGRDIRPITLDLGGRQLTGVSATARGFSMHGGNDNDWRFEVVSYVDEDGVAWLISFQRQLGDAAGSHQTLAQTFDFVSGKNTIRLNLPAHPSDPHAAGLEAVRRSWRWR